MRELLLKAEFDAPTNPKDDLVLARGSRQRVHETRAHDPAQDTPRTKRPHALARSPPVC